MDTEIEEAAAYAARLIVDQHCSWALARTKLTEAFGKRCPMPSGADVETAVREHLSIFYPDHPALLAALRAEAAAVMRDLAEAGITAYLAGPVLNGAATDDSNITLECFAESGKDAELALLNLNINWEPIDPQATPYLHPIEALGWLRPIRRGAPPSAAHRNRTPRTRFWPRPAASRSTMPVTTSAASCQRLARNFRR